MTPTERPAKRVRTDAQLAKKRAADREKHQMNRAESKIRLENIERDVAFLRDSIGDILARLPPAPSSSQPQPQPQQSSEGPSQQQAQPPPEPQLPTPTTASMPANEPVGAAINNWIHSTTTPNTYGQAQADPGSSSAAAAAGAPSVSPIPSPNTPSTGTAIPTPNTPSGTSTSSIPNTVVACHCGRVHKELSECLEFNSFTVLYETQKALLESPLMALSIPKNPTLPNLLLISTQDNSLTMFLGSTLRQFQVGNVETLCGLYLIAYRLLRWRIYPNPQWLEDVPEMMRPTEVQMARLHPVSVDFLPWPALRDYICLHQHNDSRHSVDLYIKCMRLNWPKEEELLCRNGTGVVDLNPRFESIAFDAKNWYLASPWPEMFPRLKKYVT